MSARIYTPTTDGTCAVCRRPQGEHSRQAWGAVCLPETVTAETVTDEHLAIVHGDGSACEDGCDAAPLTNPMLRCASCLGVVYRNWTRCTSCGVTPLFFSVASDDINARAKGGR